MTTTDRPDLPPGPLPGGTAPGSHGPDGGAEPGSGDGPLGLRYDPRHFGIDPGDPWPDDVPRGQDDSHWKYENDPKGAQRAEIRIAFCWTLTVLAAIGLAWVYVAGGNTPVEGALWATAFLGLGVGFILWGRDLLPGHEVTASRGHHDICAEQDRNAVAESFSRGVEPMARRPFLYKMLGAVGAIFGVAAIFPLASLGPRPHENLYDTGWGKGTRALTVDGNPIKPSDIPVNGILTVFPEGNMDNALSSTLLINIGDPSTFEIPPARVGWNIGGLVAFSKICTHAGCPVALFNVSTHQLVCPCHQSTFDVLEDCKPVFGPAPRSLPQLAITTDSSGHVVAQHGYLEPVGPGFLEPRLMSTTEERAAEQKRFSNGKSALDTVDERFGSSRFLTSVLDKIFPDHWSFMIGEVAMDSLIILIVTGIYLTFFYVPSSTDVIYAPTSGNVYTPLLGQHMTEAYRSVIDISFNTRTGLVMRQAHHWAALIFLAAVLFHMCRIFFTGAFRKPREINWIIGLTLWMVVMLEGFTGYSLPDDLLSGTGLRVIYSIVEGIPFIGTWLVYNVWGGPFPGTSFITRLFVIHEFLFPLLIIGLLTAHLMILWHQKHTDFPGVGKTETNIRGSRIWPQYAAKATGLFMIVSGVIFLFAGVFQINPVWIYGPYTPYTVSIGSQPDWYLGWLDGSVRLWPHWEFRSFGHEIANPVFPGLLIPGLLFTVMYAWPWIDKKIYNDYRAHNLLDRPWDKPFRTGVGVAAIIFFTVLTLACATDILANNFHIAFERLIEILQYSALIGPVVGFLVAYKACQALQKSSAHPIQRPVGGIIVRTADGAYHTLSEHHGDGHADENGHGKDGQGADAAESEAPARVGGRETSGPSPP